MMRRHVHAAFGLLLLASLGGCVASGPSPDALAELTVALEDPEQVGRLASASCCFATPITSPC